MRRLNYEKIEGGYNIYYNSLTFVGEILVKEDGFYDFYPPYGKSGYYDSWVMREIADKLDELNKGWEENINEYFGERNDQTT